MESTVETLSIAKVKVEYHDPSGIFPLISGQLESRLPLRNLHWKSPSRPLRSIESLHVELTKASGDAGASTGLERPASGDQAPATKERRHQMPGLRETPYLKLYLLRCDDSDSYKVTYRKAVRDWLKTHTPASQSSSKKNSQENHDAYEWMILHVVLPNTNAAKEPLSSAVANKSEASSSTDTKSSKFLNRGSGTLLEKLKADFNVSGKNSPDRVAQIRLSNDNLQNSQNPPKQFNRLSLASQEQMEAWDDVISKFKSLILASFSLRVGQYEEDIREKDSQRSLPGWNFCTFFVLKEGLAQGFERVGLLDDTLAGYEELSIDLDNLLANKEHTGPMDSFLPNTDEIKQLYQNAKNPNLTDSLSWNNGNRPISATRKPFRELILANNVSVYDFKVYVLARKLDILNRMSHMAQGTEDLVPLAQMCQLGSSEIPNLSRVVREEILQLVPDSQSDETKSLIDNIVDSWAFATAQQLLDETNSAYLSQSSPSEPSFSTLLREKPSTFPTRKSSLAAQSPQDKDDAQSLFDKLRGRLDVSDPNQAKSGKDYLAMQRAQLLLLQRRILEILAVKHDFSIGWQEARKKLSGPSKMSDVSLSEEEEEETDSSEPPSGKIDATLDGIYQQALSNALTSKSNLLRAYEKLTIAALDLFFTAGHGKSFERMLADLAVLKFQLGDYAAASNFFAKIIPIYSHLQWGLIETEMLLVHAKCLKVLNRKDDYVRMLLGLLAKAISIKSSGKPQITLDDYDIEDCVIDKNPLLPELLTYSAQLPYEVAVEMSTYFTNIHIEPYIHHHDDKEGFYIKAKFRSHFEHQFNIDKARLLLVSSEGASREINLENETAFQTKKGTNNITLCSSITTFGLFTVQRLSLSANKIAFVHDFHIEDETELPYSQSLQIGGPKILCYPSANSFEVQLSTSRTIHIDQIRCLEITCLNGPNDMKMAEMRLKPLTSGLRLRTADAKIISGTGKINTKASQGAIAIPELEAGSKFTISIPYELEDSHHEISVRIDVVSSTPALDYNTTQSVVADLPLDVNVHDLFKPKHIFSRFHVRTSTESPIRALKVHLEKTDAFTVEPSLEPSMPTIIFSRQPATFMYKIRPRGRGKAQTRQRADQEKPLQLVVDYQCLDEVIKTAIMFKFSADLAESEFVLFKRFLMQVLQERLNTVLQHLQYTDFTMLNEITVPSFEDIGWYALTANLPLPASDRLCQWLKGWHESCSMLELPDSERLEDFQVRDFSFSPRKIIISVPLPRVHVLCSAKLAIQSPFPDPVPVGHPLQTTLILKHGRHWDCPPSDETYPDKMEFMYDVDSPPDTWLIGGQRRGRFFAEEDEVKNWTVVLIPLRTGKLLLPSVDVRPVGKGMEEIGCETEYSSSGKSVLVVGDLQRTTIAMSSNEAFIVSADRQV